MDNDKEYNDPEGQEEESQDKFEVEKEWAERLKMNFDSQRASTPPPAPRQEAQEASRPVPPPYEGPRQPEGVPPMYTMPPGTELPPRHPHEPMPPTFMVWAIVATICCCLPAGIVAIIFSSKVSTKYFSRDYEGARKASERAQIWIIISIVLGIISNALYIPMMLMMSL